MAYKIDFPGMTKFQKQFGGQGLTGLSGIVPMVGPNPAPKLLPISRKK